MKAKYIVDLPAEDGGGSFLLREIELRYRGPRYRAPRLCSSSDCAPVFKKLIGEDTREQFITLLLDTPGHPIGFYRLLGSSSSVGVVPADILRAALFAGAASLIFGHNHPSGDCTPSADDIKLTGRLEAAAKLLGLAVHDHIVVGQDGEYFSMCDAGLMGRESR